MLDTALNTGDIQDLQCDIWARVKLMDFASMVPGWGMLGLEVRTLPGMTTSGQG